MYDNVPASLLADTGAEMSGADPRVCNAVCACMHMCMCW